MPTASPRPDRETLLRGSAIGAVVFATGYVLTYVWRANAVNDSLRGLNFLAQLLGVDPIPTWKGVAWLFYGAHGVATRFPLPGGGTELVNLVQQSGDATVGLLYALVPALLLVGGAISARLADARTPVTGAAAGATVTTGYLVIAALGTQVAAHPVGDTGATIAPDPVTGILLAGLIYPLVLGAVGGALASYR